jgi:circadian clock protein KaiC
MTETRNRLPTGISGLDEVLGGGLIPGGIYLVMGRPGAGKTICGNQLCFAHAARSQRAAYVTLLAETHSRMTSHLERMRFYSAACIGSSLKYLGGYAALREKDLPGLMELLRRILRTDKPSLLVIDGLMTSRAHAANDVALKEFIIALQVLSSMSDCTTVLLSNMTAQDLSGPEHTMVDGLIELAMVPVKERTLRSCSRRPIASGCRCARASPRGRSTSSGNPRGGTASIRWRSGCSRTSRAGMSSGS